MKTEAEKRASAKYDAKNTVQLKVKLNRKTDMDIIEKVSNVPNKQGYIKKLIRDDMKEDCNNLDYDVIDFEKNE